MTEFNNSGESDSARLGAAPRIEKDMKAIGASPDHESDALTVVLPRDEPVITGPVAFALRVLVLASRPQRAEPERRAA